MKDYKISRKKQRDYFPLGEDSANVLKELNFELCLEKWRLGMERRFKKRYPNN